VARKMMMDPGNPGFLLVHLLKGVNLISADINGSSDPYVAISVGNSTIRSRIVEKSLNPEWNETISFVVPKGTSRKIVFKVMDKDIITDDFLGDAQYDFSSLRNMEEKGEELKLNKVKSGTIKFWIRWIDFGSDTESRDRYGFLLSSAGETTESAYDTSRPPETYHRNVAGKLGIPFPHKTPFWQVFGLQAMSLPPAPYGDLDYRKLKKLSPVPVVVNQINLDIPRTFPHHPSFSTPEMQLALRNILNAYAVKNPALGYCQSLNFIGAALLLTMRETDAFLLLCFIVEHLFPEYWTHSMLGVQVDLLVLDYYL